jgi:integrase
MAPEHHNKNVRLAVVPIRSRTCIQRIVKMLRPNPRDHLLFVLGVNNGIRLRDLLGVTCGQLRDNSQPGDYFDIWEGKTKKFNIMVVNDPVAEAIKMYFDKFPERDGDDPAFFSQKTDGAITVEYGGDLVQKWCKKARCPKGRYGAHTLRKTWGYIQRTVYGTPWEVICDRYNHDSPATTKRYLGITQEERVRVCMAPVT